MTLGQKITELRKSQSLTQERLSEKLGVSRQTIANWEADS
ncbi:MAG: helix-turn-helix transcriptional regulator, partial [Firmicutes bacterium]|nr:helix-turn-helix transcriptional regulator [Bacillota bacterium]